MKDFLINLSISILTFCIIIMVLLLVLSQFNVSMWDYYNKTCNELNGTLITYECFNTPINNGFCDLESTKTGQYCVLDNGSEIDLTIRSAIK